MKTTRSLTSTFFKPAFLPQKSVVPSLFSVLLLISSPCSFAYSEVQDARGIVEVAECGVTITNKKAKLVKDLNCTLDQLTRENAAIVLKHASLDLNGKTIYYTGFQPQGIGILLEEGSEVFANKDSSQIKNFHTNAKIIGNNSRLFNFTIKNSINGIEVHGHQNNIADIHIADIGGVIDQSLGLLVGEGKGVILYGDDNILKNLHIKNVGYEFFNDIEVSSMFAYGIGIDVVGNRNIITDNQLENIFGKAHALYNAHASVYGIRIGGNENTIEKSKISHVHGSGSREMSGGMQTGSIVMGVTLSNLPNELGKNRITDSKINNVLAHAKREIQEGHAGDIIAEAYGIQAIYNGHQIVRNEVSEVDAIAEDIQIAAGIRIVDENHLVVDNISRNHGLRMSEETIFSVSKVMGISIDAINSRIENNWVENNQGFGISSSTVSADNHINFNESLHNKDFDFIEQSNENTSPTCNNDWQDNNIVNATFYPQQCFI